jgi:hypothetical protein
VSAVEEMNGEALLASPTPTERRDLLVRYRAKKSLERVRAAQRAEARARRAMLKALSSPQLLEKVEAAKEKGLLVESRERPGVWFMGAYEESDPVRLYLHVTIGVVVGEDGATYVEPWARERR